MSPESRRTAWARASAFEAGVWRSLGAWLLRRPVSGPGESAHPYFGAMRTNYAIFIALSAIEIPVLHVLIPWQTVRLVLVVLSIWGLIWCLGLLASMTRHPHLISPTGVRLRYGATVDVPIAWEAIAGMAMLRDLSSEGRVVQIVGEPGARRLQLAISNQTNLVLRLREPLEITLPAGRFTIASASFFADDPQAMLAGARAAEDGGG